MDELKKRINARIGVLSGKAETLYGLARTYRAEGKDFEAERVERQAGELASQSYGLSDALGIIAIMEDDS